MKLKSCYIAGFGTLKDREYGFEDGFTQFFQENGAGKSTLAAFLKAMLFGLASYKSNSRTFEDRRHYCPFDGGAFGGSLTLEFEGKTYCITRRFDMKSETRDHCSVTRDGVPTEELGKVPGRTIFQVDEDSFLRTAFFTADPGELGANGCIAGRLQSFVDNTQPGGDYEDACAALENAARDLKSPRGQIGKIYQQQSRIRALEQALQNRTQWEHTLQDRYQSRQDTQQQLTQTQTLRTQTVEKQFAWERWNFYRGLAETARNKQKGLTRLRASCGTPQPTPPQRELLRSRLQENQRLQTLAQHSELSGENRQKLDALRRGYPAGLPDQGVLTEGERLQGVLSRLETPPEKKSGALPMAILTVGVLAAVAGAVLGVWNRLPPMAAVGIGAVGLVAAAVGLFLLLWNAAQYRGALAEHNAQKEKTQTALDALLSPFGLSAVTAQIRTDSMYLHNLCGEEASVAQKRGAYLRARAAGEEQMRQVLSGCGLYPGEELAGFVENLLSDLQKLEALEADATNASRAAEDYRTANALTEPVDPPSYSIPQLEQQEWLYSRQLATLDKDIQDLEYNIEDLADCHLRLGEAKELLAQMEQRYSLLQKAKQCLQEAEATLRRKHIHPVRSRLDHYAALLEQTLGARLELDGDFSLYLLEKGAQYPVQHLSAGQRTLAALCLRLALLDNLYPGDKPPIFLDDPFVFLDEAHMENAGKLLAALCGDWQILYFTCHESRKINA